MYRKRKYGLYQYEDATDHQQRHPAFIAYLIRSEKLNNLIRDEAIKAHLEARQRTDIRRDLAQKLRPSDGPFEPDQRVCTGTGICQS